MTSTSISTSCPTVTAPRWSKRAGSAKRTPSTASLRAARNWKARSSIASCIGSLAPSVSTASATRTSGRGLIRRGRHREDIGQVVLALGIAVAQPRQPGTQHPGLRQHDAGIDQSDRALVGAGVLLFDDGGNPAAVIEHQATVAGGIGELRREHAQGAGLLHEPAQGIGPDQRNVAVEHQHARRVGDLRHRLLHGMSGSQLLRLLDPEQIGLRGKGLAHLLPAMAVHHVDAARRRARAPRRSHAPASAGPRSAAAPWAAWISCACPRLRRGSRRATVRSWLTPCP